MSITKVTDAGISTNRIVNPLIINGDMSLAQRGTSINNTDEAPYLIDRFRNQAVYGSTAPTATIAISQSTTVPTGQGFVKSTKYDVTTAQGSLTTDTGYALEQRIEGQNLQMIKKGTSNAEKLTLAFWVRSNKTGTYVVELADMDNSRQCSQSYTISSADTWEKKILNYPADTTGAYDNDNATSLKIRIWVAAGATYTNGTLATTWASTSAGNSAVGQVNLVDSTDNEWYITGLQMEVGEFDSNTIPSFPFEDHSTSLLRCQRYFNQMKQNGSDSNIRYCSGICTSSTATEMAYVVFPELRSTPTLVLPAANKFRVRSASAVTCSSISADNRHKNGVNIQASVSSGLSSGDGCNFDSNASDSLIQLDAEL
jgi:hypothetical protein